MKPTIGSLFSGIGGLELGLERATGGRVVWQAEIDPFCREVLAHHWPQARRYEDVRHITHAAEPVDIVCGGFPCQDVSVAGTRVGLDGARSGLWSEFARVVRELRPRVVVVENSAALLVRGFDRVVGDLAEVGFDCWWDCIPAAAVGAPHRRDRVYVVAWRVPDAERDRLRNGAERGSDPAPTPDSGHAEPKHMGSKLADADGQRRRVERFEGEPRNGRERRAPGHEPNGSDCPQWPPGPDDLHAWRSVPADSQPAVCRLAHGSAAFLARRRAKLRALGNAVVPQVAEALGPVLEHALQASRE